MTTTIKQSPEEIRDALLERHGGDLDAALLDACAIICEIESDILNLESEKEHLRAAAVYGFHRGRLRP